MIGAVECGAEKVLEIAAMPGLHWKNFAEDARRIRDYSLQLTIPPTPIYTWEDSDI